ncbi:MAG: NADH:quinone oxidoreductase subunit RnfC [Desulfovibrionaceae bacterium]|jgi:electron transport complex protein RnfC|nr:NADH:quinone oxidoreductase subunit RnfC [Desulfovibrionaceae bacterium]
MTSAIFQLTSGAGGAIQDGPAESALAEVRVPLCGHTPVAKKKALVAAGTLLATHPDAGVGDAHSPIVGTVTDIAEDCVVIAAGIPAPKKEGEEPPVPPSVAKVDLSSADGAALAAGLKGLGVSTAALAGASTIVINGLNPEPGMSVAEQLLKEAKPALEKGLAVLAKLAPGARVVLVTAEGSSESLAGVTAFHVKPVYPNSLALLVAAAVAGNERAEGVAVIGVAELRDMGAAYGSGLPVIDTVLSVGAADYKVLVGTPVSAVLAQAGLAPADGDTVAVGGVLRGEAIADLSRGVAKGDLALAVIPAGAFPPITDGACVNCGECVLHCPSRIMPNLLGRYAEFKMWDMCAKFDIGSCIDCGLCGYYCPSRRPMLQYLRMARLALAAADAPAPAPEEETISEEA